MHGFFRGAQNYATYWGAAAALRYFIRLNWTNLERARRRSAHSITFHFPREGRRSDTHMCPRPLAPSPYAICAPVSVPYPSSLSPDYTMCDCWRFCSDFVCFLYLFMRLPRKYIAEMCSPGRWLMGEHEHEFVHLFPHLIEEIYFAALAWLAAVGPQLRSDCMPLQLGNRRKIGSEHTAIGQYRSIPIIVVNIYSKFHATARESEWATAKCAAVSACASVLVLKCHINTY